MIEMEVIWRVLTPSGYLFSRVEGTEEQAEEWCRNHYLVWRLEEEDSDLRYPDGELVLERT